MKEIHIKKDMFLNISSWVTTTYQDLRSFASGTSGFTVMVLFPKVDKVTPARYNLFTIDLTVYNKENFQIYIKEHAPCKSPTLRFLIATSGELSKASSNSWPTFVARSEDHSIRKQHFSSCN